MRIEQLINDSHQKVIKQHTSTNSQQERKGMEKTDNEPVQEAFVSTEKDKVDTVVSKLNEFLAPLWTHLQFVLHEDLDKYYVIVSDLETDEVIREIPQEKMLDMYAAMAEYMGLLIDEKI